MLGIFFNKKWMCLIILYVLLMAITPIANGIEFYVSPNGIDSNPGSIEKPFATLFAARSAVRQLKSEGRLDSAVTIYVRQGEYFLDGTFSLEKQDSGSKDYPIIYRAFEGEKPILAGGRLISGWVRSEGNILKADLSHTELKGIPFKVLIFDGKRQQLARYPNHDDKDMNGGRWAYVDGERISMYSDSPDEDNYLKENKHLDFWQRNIPRLTRTLKVKTQDVHKWSNPEQGKISIFPRFNWWHYILDINSFDPNQRVLNLGSGCFYEIRAGDRYFIQGLREELDSPGEWYYDRAESILYFWPPEPIEKKHVYVSTLKNIIKMQDCSNITFQGFTIECCEGTAVDMNDCTDCKVVANTIRNAGDASDSKNSKSHFEGSAVSVQGGSKNGIIGNDIYDIGSYGIYLSGGDVESLTLAGNYAENNYIHHVGVVDRKAKAIELTGSGNIIRHNLIHDIPQSGIYVWGNKHIIEYNHIRHTCLEAEDTGAIGGGAIEWLDWQGVVIRYNYIHDTIGFGYDEQSKTWRSNHFTWAIYPDWAASGVQIVGNILVRAPLALIHMHSGRENLIENNILVDGQQSQMDWNGWTTKTGFWSTMVDGWIKKYESAVKHDAWREIETLKDPRKVPLPDGQVMYGNISRRNIIYYHNPMASIFRFRQVPLDKNQNDYNLIYHFGLPIITGKFTVKSEKGPNHVSNAGLEAGPVGEYPKDWLQVSKPEDNIEICITDDQAHDGKYSLKVDTGVHHGDVKVHKELYIPFGPVPFESGKAYRLRVWMKNEGKPAEARLVSHSWWFAQAVEVRGEWKSYELIFRLPKEGEDYRSAIEKTFQCRLSLPAGCGKFWLDDISLQEVELNDEWQAWQSHGMDQHSIIADPLFQDPNNDDYRLKPESPAFKLGFKEIPVEKIGPYKDKLRASWPITEAYGAREMQNSAKIKN